MKNLFFILLIIYHITIDKKINKTNNKVEEVFLNKNSSTFLQSNDSLVIKAYESVFKEFESENYAKALKDGLKLYDLTFKSKNLYWNYKTSKLLSDLFYKTKRYEESVKYYKINLEILNTELKESNNSTIKDIDLASNFFDLGSAYLKLYLSKKNKTESPYFNIKKSDINFEQYLDSAKFYYQEVENFPELNKEIEIQKAKAYTSLSGIYELDSLYEKAEDYSRKAIGIHKKYNNDVSRAAALNNLGNIYLSQKKYLKSKIIYLEAIDLVKNNSSSRIYRVKADLYYNLAWAMRNLEEFEAYDFQEESYEIEGIIREKEVRGILEQVKAEYDFDTKKSLFEKQEENRRLIAQRKFILFGIIALLVILSLIYILKVNRLKQNNLALQLQRTELLKNKELDKLKSESQTRIINATIDGKESERKQIAETLHDSVSALLSSANLHLQATRKQFNGSTPIEIDKTQEIILEATHKIRDLSHTLVSSVLLKFGLKFAVVDISEKYSNSELTISTEINNIRRYHQNFEIKIYNILQEFLNNILKHSKAKSALIKLKEENECLFITIKDDGVGFDKTKVDENDGLGINQIDARVKMLKGSFNIESSEGNGAKIYVKIPIVEKEKSTHVFPIQ